VAGSSWTSTGVELTVTGNTIASATVAFNKATYAPGERAVITITTKDTAGRLLANGASGTLAAAFSNYTLTGSTSLPYRGTSTSGSDVTYSTTLTEYLDTGVETRVVTMPTIGADVTYTIHVPGFGVGSSNTPVTASAKVVDPNATAIAGSTAAAEAATDAAAEAIDAANAATDAANLAAEAADAATVAAEEARDAADAATAAVEELATQVATLMAAAASAASRASSAATVAASAASAERLAASVAALAASIASFAASVAASAAACAAAIAAAFAVWTGSTTVKVKISESTVAPEVLPINV